ncbi:MAG: hypothetical protein FP825_09715 [Hyphomonas sp.]|uniref:hypothetical protein n=1 Tax=Hyphomonas sp. TaxID=87 RepID=UPI00181EDF97|nr:hypothetical protein [Hyphomonas sp.]MBA3068745.1 hypothetical protein [Hyphomonas sp.]MBU3920792.1 hypothetical protein [Alphaproteobacteria bacterium]MBU4063591.1 hypothetical protein [Alphaproteobacteria bacterium]MBU4165784.1 hypothetical protein [Alphaproteobacteria bacterium]
MAVLEWCKLFADNQGWHFWRRVVTDVNAFELGLLVAAGRTQIELDRLIQQTRTYRDRFVAHLDNELVMHIPDFDPLLRTASYYFSHVVMNEMTECERLRGGLTDLDQYYQDCFDEAVQVFALVPQP